MDTKQHYGVSRIASRNSRSETLLLFFGIHMANAATLAALQLAIEEKPRDSRVNIIKSFYVKFEHKIPALVEDFCRYYAEHRNKTVVYYFDATALGSNYAVNEQNYRWWVVHEFERRGWRVEAVNLGNPMRHYEKYLLIN